MKRIFASLTLIACLLLSCGREIAPAGTLYTYEGEGFGGPFTIRLAEDGTCTYYEGMLSSHLGLGEWHMEGDTVILTVPTGDTTWKQVFQLSDDGETLYFVEKGSHNFLHITLENGAKFHISPETQRIEETEAES